MKFFHLADLHFGKNLHGLSLLESGDQPFWVDRFLEFAAAERPDAVVIAGDVYDRGLPPGPAVGLLSRMLTALAEMDIPVLLIAGNHDSVQRLGFAAPLLARQKLYIAPPLTDQKELMHVTLQDAHGPVTFWLMPYLFPALAAQALGRADIRDYDAAVRAVLAAQPVDHEQRNVIVAHQNVTAGGAEGPRGGSETMVGGVGQVEHTAFDGFDYVALGHIHAAYPVGRPEVRYAGSPLCYHFEETRQAAKGPLLVTLEEKGAPAATRLCPIPPLHPLREAKGPYEALRDSELANPARGEYLRIVLTDQAVTPAAADFFRSLAQAKDSVLMEITSEYRRAAGAAVLESRPAQQPVEELFAGFYTQRHGGEAPAEEDLALLAFAGEETRRAAPGARPDKEAVERLLAFAMKQEVTE